jgi:hypothetical protein
MAAPVRLPKTFYALVGMFFIVQPLLFLVKGQALDPRGPALAVTAALLYFIARGSWIAWGVVFAYTALLSLLVLLVPSLNASWIMLTAYNAATLYLLLSRSLRGHLRARSTIATGPAMGV